MNSNWKKAKWDVVSKEDLERWYEVESAMGQKPILTYFHHLEPVELPELDTESLRRLSLLFNDDESWGDPQELEFAENSSWDLTDWAAQHMLVQRIWESSMNQVLDEDVDFLAIQNCILI